MAAENDVDAGDAAGELEVDVHAVMREQHHRLRALAARLLDQLLQLALLTLMLIALGDPRPATATATSR
jgi:hypothetical protein